MPEATHLTVKALVERLQQLPQDAKVNLPVNCMCCGNSRDRLDQISFDDDIDDNTTLVVLHSNGLHGINGTMLEVVALREENNT